MHRNLRRAFSLLEVVTAMTISSLMIVPTASMLSQAIAASTSASNNQTLVRLAEGKLAEESQLARANFRQNRTQRGRFRREGFPGLRYQATVRSAAAAGGIPNRMVSINVVAWDDQNSNSRLDTGEQSVHLWSAVTRVR